MAGAATAAGREDALSAASPGRYQPALDGVRAVAVAAVLLYHAGVAWIPGGFLGVDVFFVLSGYLITRLLVDEWRAGGRIDVRRFWQRRARRLGPALLVVLAAVVVVAGARGGLGRSAASDVAAALAYVSNWRFVASSASYFERFAAPSPVLHTWSLAVEAQWYVLWPVLLAAGLRAARGRAHRLVPVVLAGAAGSAAAMALLASSHVDPSRAYYGTDARSQALLVGAALALALHAPAVDRVLTRHASVVGVAGAVACGLLIAVAHDTDPWLYRGGFAIAAVAAAAVVVAARDPSRLVGRALAARPLAAVGRLSYGLYLWHWPVFVWLGPDTLGGWGGDAALLVMRFGVTAALAAVSYRVLEQPIRRAVAGRATVPKVAVAVAATATIAASVVAIAVEPRPVEPALASAASAGDVLMSDAERPRSASAPDPTTVLVVGDSVAWTLVGWGAAEDAVGDRIAVSFRTMIGCGIADGRPVAEGGALPVEPECATWRDVWRDGVERVRPDVALVLIGAWEVFDQRVGGRTLRVGTDEYGAHLAARLDDAIAILSARDAEVVLLTTPCNREEDFGLGGEAGPRSDARRVAWFNGVLRAAAARSSGRASVVDLGAFLCPGGRYEGERGGVALRSDGVHLARPGAVEVWRWLAPQLEDRASLGF